MPEAWASFDVFMRLRKEGFHQSEQGFEWVQYTATRDF